MSAAYVEAMLQLLGTGFGVYAHHQSLQQERRLHEHEHTASLDQHYSSVSMDLLAIAKEADRDVWEQRNNQYSNMLVCAVLMFGVAVGNINEGTYSFSEHVDSHGSELASLFSKDGAFVILSAIAISSLFACIVACLLVMRRMSAYMIERSSNLVDRLAVCTSLAHQISSDVHEGGSRMGRVKKERFREKLGATIGSARAPHNKTPFKQRPGIDLSQISADTTLDGTSSEESDLRFEGRGTPFERTATEALLGRHPTAPLNFSIFYREHCVWLTHFVNWTFVAGVVVFWSSLWFLLWNQFPHLYVPVFGFLLIGVVVSCAAARMESATRRRDRIMANTLRNDGLAAPISSYSPPSPDLPPTEAHTPPPSPPSSLPEPPPTRLRLPPPRPAPRPRPPAPQLRSVSARLRELAEVERLGMLTEDEYTAKRAEILAAL
jgi:hypothetical protein